MQSLAEKMSFVEIVPLSAQNGSNVEELERTVVRYLPEAEAMYPADQITDRSERFLAAEIVREKLMRELGQELPYAVTVEIEQFKEEEGLLRISALIWVERDSQKRIVIGKKGEQLKEIGRQARIDMEKLFDNKVFLQLWVKVKEGWSDNERLLNSLGYREE
jgi:GTP-binding protein Era